MIIGGSPSRGLPGPVGPQGPPGDPASVTGVETDLAAHVADRTNPHAVTAAQVGLGPTATPTFAELTVTNGGTYVQLIPDANNGRVDLSRVNNLHFSLVEFMTAGTRDAYIGTFNDGSIHLSRDGHNDFIIDSSGIVTIGSPLLYSVPNSPPTLVASASQVSAWMDESGSPSLLSFIAKNSVGTASNHTSIRADAFYGDGSHLTGIPASVTAADPTALVGTSARVGTAATFMRSDAAPALDPAASPTFAGLGIGTSIGASTKLQVNGLGLFTAGAYNPGDGTPAGVSVGYDVVNDWGFVQAVRTSVALKPLLIQPGGGDVRIGTTSASGLSNVKVHVVDSLGYPVIDYDQTASGYPCSFSLANSTDSWRIRYQTNPNKGWFEMTDSIGSIQYRLNGKDTLLASDGVLGWSSESNYATAGVGARDLGLARDSAGVLRVTDGGGGGYGSVHASSFYGDGSHLTGISASVTAADPTALVGVTAHIGTAATFMRSDAAPALDPATSPTFVALELGGAARGLSTTLQVDGRSLFAGGPANAGPDGSPAGVSVGYDAGGDYGFIQSIQSGTAYKPLRIQPSGGGLDLGNDQVHAASLLLSGQLQVGDRALFVGGAYNPGADGSPAGVAIGYDVTNDWGFIQSIHAGSAFKPLKIQPGGGSVSLGTSQVLVSALGVGTSTIGSGTTLEVSGRSLFSGGAFNPGPDGSPAGVAIGYDASNDWGYIEAIQAGVGYKPLRLQQGGSDAQFGGNVRAAAVIVSGASAELEFDARDGGANYLWYASANAAHLYCNLTGDVMTIDYLGNVTLKSGLTLTASQPQIVLAPGGTNKWVLYTPSGTSDYRGYNYTTGGDGFSIRGSDNLATFAGRVVSAAPNSAPTLGTNGTMSTYIDESALNLNFATKFSDGSLHTFNLHNPTYGSALTASSVPGLPLNAYGTNAALLSTPDAWEDVTVAGQVYKRPLYLPV